MNRTQRQSNKIYALDSMGLGFNLSLVVLTLFTVMGYEV